MEIVLDMPTHVISRIAFVQLTVPTLSVLTKNQQVLKMLSILRKARLKDKEMRILML